jgi:hypothetical protein
MLEWFTVGFSYSLLKDGLAWLRGRRRRLTPTQVLELRQKWKKEIEPILWKRTGKKFRMDVIIRDVQRLDKYPEDTEPNRHGISAWFKVGLTCTYHNGIEVNLGWHSLVKEDYGWRLADYHKDDKDRMKTVALVATIPYERIEKIDWTGDTFYGNSQVYCHFDGKKGMPYEDFFFATQEQNPGGPYFYLKVADEEVVRKNSERAGTAWPKRKRQWFRKKKEEELES